MKTLLTTLLLALGLIACGAREADAVDAKHAATEEPAKGPHNGRLLRDGAFTLELAIFENGVPPEYRAWATLDGKAVSPDAVQLTVDLARFGGVKQVVAFKPNGGFLQGTSEVFEPHSFDVTVQAAHAGQTHRWAFESYEGRTTIAAAMAAQAGIEVAAASAGSIAEQLALYGTIAPDASRVRQVTARFPGVIRSMVKNVSERVQKGETLARIESNDSLQIYAVTAPISGLITARHGAVGEITDTESLYTVADFSSVVAELQAYPRDRARLTAGQTITVRAEDGREAATSLASIAAQGQSGSPAVLLRAVLDNADGRWTPGEFITASVRLRETAVPLRVPLAALQTFRDWDVVFAVDGESYQALPVELGQRDAGFVEVRAGLAAGTRIVVANSYLVKADIEKSGASHDH